LIHRYLFDGNDGALVLLIDRDHLGQNARGILDGRWISGVVVAEVVGEDDGEGFIADEGFACEDGMPQALHLYLSGIGEGTV
jgi:PIN domain nuclease of toxin-antitoxin system